MHDKNVLLNGIFGLKSETILRIISTVYLQN